MEEETKFTREDLIEMLAEMVKSYENLPPHASASPLLVMDHYSLLVLLLAIFKAKD
jgi:hypothetical protein